MPTKATRLSHKRFELALELALGRKRGAAGRQHGEGCECGCFCLHTFGLLLEPDGKLRMLRTMTHQQITALPHGAGLGFYLARRVTGQVCTPTRSAHFLHLSTSS